jgi:hypothetical protein
MGPSIILFERDPAGRNVLWILMTVFFALMLAHRLTASYELDGKKLTAKSLFNVFFPPPSIPYEDIDDVETRRTFATGVVGCGHVFAISADRMTRITLLAQRDPERIKELLERLAAGARRGKPGAAEKGSAGDPEGVPESDPESGDA